MKKELDEALVRDFPNLYADRHANMQVTAMCWGFPGTGWHDIIRRLSEKLEAMILKLPEKSRTYCKASQVKEKYGTLRFYMTTSTDEMEDAISEAEEESGRTCEVCGQPGKVLGASWYYAACKEHAEERQAYLFVFTEHFGFHIFDLDDLTYYAQYTRIQDLEQFPGEVK